MTEINQTQNLEVKPKTELHQEIADLEKKLEEKKRLAEISGIEAPVEKEIFKEVIREHIAEKKSQSLSAMLPAQAQTQQQQTSSDADRIKEMAEQKQLEELVNISTIKSPMDAVRIAEHMKNPKLLDDLHDYLADQLYDHLIEIRKLREL